jgi:hypothetical protein
MLSTVAEGAFPYFTGPTGHVYHRPTRLPCPIVKKIDGVGLPEMLLTYPKSIGS